MSSDYKWTVRLSIVTPILAAVCIFFMGGGHGWYKPTMVLFPIATINLIWEDHLSITFLLAGLLQFVLYGFIIDNAKKTKKSQWSILGIIIFHVVLVIFILSFPSPSFR